MVRTKRMNRLVWLAVLLLLLLSGCAEKETTDRTSFDGHCTLSISCETALQNSDRLDPGKLEILPADGWILPETEVAFQTGESVFDLLSRVCREKKIHMAFQVTPVYGSAYIEGINNLYEFDCGDLSGWMYSVNGVFPNVGCSQVQAAEGDVICFVYTCDLGADVGGADAAN